jgi:hypothetical protein
MTGVACMIIMLATPVVSSVGGAESILTSEGLGLEGEDLAFVEWGAEQES